MVRHAHIAKVRGSMRLTHGVVTVGKDLESSSVDVEVDPSSVSTGVGDRDDMLRSPDIFDVASYPAWSFVSTSVSGGPDTYLVAGDLTVHGVTRAVVLDTEFNGVATTDDGEVTAGFSATVTVDRRDFGVTWTGKTRAHRHHVSDEVVITLELAAIKQGG
jgi:polyisoprenoid-binding protein YceI